LFFASCNLNAARQFHSLFGVHFKNTCFDFKARRQKVNAEIASRPPSKKQKARSKVPTTKYE